MVGHPVRIVVSNSDHKLELDYEAVGQIVLENNVRDADLMLVSVVGAFDQGKLLLMNSFLHYLINRGHSNWMESEDVPIRGFSRLSSTQDDSVSISVWSRVFFRELSRGQKVVLMLMNSRGVCDNHKDSAAIFALSTMTSSVLVYSIQNNLQEDHLRHLLLPTEYGRLALKEDSSKPFLKLLFLVHDWNYPYNAKYGYVGGNLLLERLLKIPDSQQPVLQSQREHIYSCFQDISAFLLPHPGPKVAADPNLSDVDVEFKKHLGTLVPSLLSVENSAVKEIGGRKMKAKDLVHYFQCYVKILSGEELPDPQMLLFATVEANNLAVLEAAKYRYRKRMDQECGRARPYVEPERLEEVHRWIKVAAVSQYVATPKMGRDGCCRAYKAKLMLDLDEMFCQYKLDNERKSPAGKLKVPVVYVTLVLISYFLFCLLNSAELHSLALLVRIIMDLGLIIVISWTIFWYHHIFADLREIIESPVDILWASMFSRR